MSSSSNFCFTIGKINFVSDHAWSPSVLGSNYLLLPEALEDPETILELYEGREAPSFKSDQVVKVSCVGMGSWNSSHARLEIPGVGRILVKRNQLMEVPERVWRWLEREKKGLPDRISVRDLISPPRRQADMGRYPYDGALFKIWRMPPRTGGKLDQLVQSHRPEMPLAWEGQGERYVIEDWCNSQPVALRFFKTGADPFEGEIWTPGGLTERMSLYKLKHETPPGVHLRVIYKEKRAYVGRSPTYWVLDHSNICDYAWNPEFHVCWHCAGVFTPAQVVVETRSLHHLRADYQLCPHCRGEDFSPVR